LETGTKLGIFSGEIHSIHLAYKYSEHSVRDVTKFEFDNVQMFSTDSKFNEWFKRFLSNANSWKFLVLRLISQRTRECRQTSVFPKFNMSHKLQLLNEQHSLMCYTVLI